MPVVDSDFSGNRYFRNRHLETIIPALFRRVYVPYAYERITLADGDFIDIDRINNGSGKLLVLFHGLEGSSQSHYMKGFAAFFSAAGFDVCAVNFRSCSGEMNRKLRSYHSGASDDIEEIVYHLLYGNPQYHSLYLCGFSLGGNALLKFLGEQGAQLNPRIKGAAAFSVPVDLAGSARMLSDFSNRLYLNRFLKSLNKKIRIKARTYPELDLKGLAKIRSFEEWDTRFTAPIHGFTDSTDYYSRCSAREFLSSIAVPTLLVNSKNDPFLSRGCFPYESARANPCLHLEVPPTGGHVGYSEGLPNGNYWSETRALSFFETLH